MFDAGIGTAAHLPLSAITEDVSHAWYRGERRARGSAGAGHGQS
jgi:hydrogenase large subunit